MIPLTLKQIFMCLLIKQIISSNLTKKKAVDSQLQTWQKIYILVGIVFIIIVFLVYKSYQNGCFQRFYQRHIRIQRRELNFVNVKGESEQTMETTTVVEFERSTQTSIEQRDEEASIDDISENNSKKLGSVFEKKQGENKRSKTRKRLAANAKVKKVREDETQKMTMDDEI